MPPTATAPLKSRREFPAAKKVTATFCRNGPNGCFAQKVAVTFFGRREFSRPGRQGVS